MKSIFAYDSKFTQILLIAADYIILNVIYVICCIPIFTIGAAQAGLYTGLRVLRDKEDDSSVVKAFFRGFANGFGKITLVWVILLVIMSLIGYNFGIVLIYQFAEYVAPEVLGSVTAVMGYDTPFWMSLAGFLICIVFQSMVTIFHSKFGCTTWQLVRNTFMTIMAHPLRSLAVTALTWLPVAVFLLFTPLFLQITPAWLAGYYSLSFQLNVIIMQKPFQIFTENFVAAYEAEHGEIKLTEE